LQGKRGGLVDDIPSVQLLGRKSIVVYQASQDRRLESGYASQGSGSGGVSVAGLFDPQQLIHPPPMWLDLTRLQESTRRAYRRACRELVRERGARSAKSKILGWINLYRAAVQHRARAGTDENC